MHDICINYHYPLKVVCICCRSTPKFASKNPFGHMEKCSYWSIGKCSYLKSTAKCSLSLGGFQIGILLFGSKRSQNCSTVNKTLESDKRGNEVNLWIRYTKHNTHCLLHQHQLTFFTFHWEKIKIYFVFFYKLLLKLFYLITWSCFLLLIILFM